MRNLLIICWDTYFFHRVELFDKEMVKGVTFFCSVVKKGWDLTDKKQVLFRKWLFIEQEYKSDKILLLGYGVFCPVKSGF